VNEVDEELPEGVGRLTELGNAHRLAAASGDSLLYAPGVGWLVWPQGGPAWRRDDAAALRLGEASVRRFLAECERGVRVARGRVSKVKAKGMARDSDQSQVAKGNLDARAAELAFAKSSQKVAQVRAMLDWTKTFDGISIEAAKLDAVPHLLASPSGTIDLRDGSIREPDRTHLLSRATNVQYLPDKKVDADAWAAYVLDLVGDRATADWLHVWAGYCLTGSAREEKFVVLHGPPGNGKGTFVESLAAAIGPDLSAALDPGMFVEKRGGGSQKAWSLARLRGVRLARFSEADGSAQLSASLLCRVTGGESVEAEAKFHQPFDYKPEWKLTFSANSLPHANPDAMRNGLWRRICLVPCRRPSASDDTQDSRIKAMWTDPLRGARGVLLWAVRGAIRYHELGRLPPRSPAMALASSRYQRSGDPLSQFMEDFYVKSDHLDEHGRQPHVDRDELYRVFASWREAQGERCYLTSAEVRDRLADPPWSIECVRSRGGCSRAYRGIRPLDRDDRDDPAEQFDRS
jgi:putative DNA primase/helicase